MNVPLSRAREFATAKHKGQKRKYSDEDYIVHPEDVAAIVASVTDDEEIIAAAFLHDVYEDTGTSIDEIERLFGSRVAELVLEVSNVATAKDGNRAERTAKNKAHLEGASYGGKTIKLADIISNTRNVVRDDPFFAKTYLAEKTEALTVLVGGDNRLWDAADKQLREETAKIAAMPTPQRGQHVSRGQQKTL